MTSISRAYDAAYLTGQVGGGRENYYLSAVGGGTGPEAKGEPPGRWTGRGCPELGLETGSKVDAYTLEQMVEGFLDPRDPRFRDRSVPASQKATLGHGARRYKGAEERFQIALAAEPEASPERREQLWIEAKKAGRKAVKGFDATFSPGKSVTLLHAACQVQAAEAREAGDAEAAKLWDERADLVWKAVNAGADAMLGVLQDEAGQSRAGYHGKDLQGRTTGRYVEAPDWIIASFEQHTSRSGDPQLHRHNLILNRVMCEDGQWRTLDSKALHRARAQASAVGERVIEQQLTAWLGVDWVTRSDGHGREIAGVGQDVMDLFSSRRAEVTRVMQGLVEAYTEKHGRAPSRDVLFSMAQHATQDTKARKKKLAEIPTREQELAEWEARSEAAERGSLSALPEAVLHRVGAEELAEREAAGYSAERVCEAAVAEVASKRTTWDRSQLIAAISRHLPEALGALDATQTRALLDELADQALAEQGVFLLTAAAPASLPASLRREDGTSIYEPKHAQRYTTDQQLASERYLLEAAKQKAGAFLPSAEAAALLGLLPVEAKREAKPEAASEAGAEAKREAKLVPAGDSLPYGLSVEQAAVVHGILTDGRAVETLVGPAGAGKSRTMGTLTTLWADRVGGRVYGVATSQVAANVLADDRISAENIAMFLNKVERGALALRADDLLIVDEAGMVATADLDALRVIVADAGAKMLLTGDPEQVQSVGAGGMMRLIHEETGGYELTEVFRMREEWERDASLQLRAGVPEALAEYDRRGRLEEGTYEQMAEAAFGAWLADTLAGRESLLVVGTNEQAADMSTRARAALVDLGLVEAGGAPLKTLGHVAGVGDLIQARHNNRNISDQAGRWVANRDVLKVVGRTELGALWVERAEKGAGGGRWLLSPTYVREHVELAYSGTVHMAQGRTVYGSYALVDEAWTREQLYVAMSRGEVTNVGFVGTDEPSRADLTPGAEEAPSVERDQARHARVVGLRVGELRRAQGLTLDGLAERAGITGDEIRALERGEADAALLQPVADVLDTTVQVLNRPQRDRWDVLNPVLERSGAEETAIEAMEAEKDRTVHLGHLGPQWVDLVRRSRESHYDAVLKRVLPAEVYARWETDDDRGPLVRLLRQAEMAGHDTDALLRVAVAERAFDTSGDYAQSVGRVLHWRLENRIGAAEPVPGGWVDRTPRIADPEISAYVREVAELMDARTATLGELAAEQAPEWATSRLGDVPTDEAERADWVRRAGVAAAYREQFRPSNLPESGDALGAAPARGNPEAYAAWVAAYKALGEPDDERDVRGAGDGELWLSRAAHQREAAWAPPHVGEDLRTTSIALRRFTSEAARLEAQALAESDDDARAAAEERAERQRQFAADMEARAAVLTEIDDARAAWYAATEQGRIEALRADGELRRRLLARGEDPAELPHLDGTEAPAAAEREHEVAQAEELPLGLPEHEAPRPAAEPEEPGREVPQAEELDLGVAADAPEAAADLGTALEKARQARLILAEREQAEQRREEGKERARRRDDEQAARRAHEPTRTETTRRDGPQHTL